MDKYENVAWIEIAFIRNQVGWMSAIASGLEDHAPEAAKRLHDQAALWMQEVLAAEKLMRE